MGIQWLPLILVLPYSVIMLWLFRHLAGLEKFTPRDKPLQAVSVIIPCRNEESNISSLLHSLSVQTYPEHLFEVLLIDDNSADNTLAIATAYRFPG